MRVAVFNDTRPSEHFGCSLVMDNLEALLCANHLEVVWRWPVGRDWRKASSLLPKRGDVDVVLVNGEGTIHHDKTRPRAMWLAEVGGFSRDELGVPAFLINATLYRNSTELYRALARFEAVFVRDSMSADELRKHGLQGQVVPDLTFARVPGRGEPAPGEEVSVKAGFCGTDSVLQEVADAIEDLCRTQGWRFIPWHRWSAHL